jgi:subtilisin family serine protease
LGIAAVACAVTATLAVAPAGATTTTSSSDVDAAMLMNFTVNSDPGAATMKKVAAAVKKAGGKVLSQYKPIGVTVAQSNKKSFATDLRKQQDLIDSVGATRTSAVDAKLLPKPDFEAQLAAGAVDPLAILDAAKIKPEPREPEQWGLAKIRSLKANEIEDGKGILVGVLDSGSNDLHEDLQANFDRKTSVDCQSNNGIPNTEDGAWRAQRAHGTHTAGTVAAARNKLGVAGVAPGVKFASIKVSNDAGFYFAEYVLCGYWWALKHGVDVTNNSYYVDPWMFWCKNDPDQGAVQESMHRMITYTQRKGMINVAAAGNAAYDLAHKTTDSSSPNDSEPIQDRPINKNCLTIPAEIDGVIAVSAIGQDGKKAGFSNYGKNHIDVAAPGVNILSTYWPEDDVYAFLSGTSMASPHVAGVVALLDAAHPGLSVKKLTKLLYKSAVDTPCDGATGCEGTAKNNGFFGHGIVDALNAVK